ncbi:MAG: sulfatase-like hydrolase/transferase [Thermoanaerobaculia bacterium]
MLLLFVALGCARKNQPTVILITIDTLRADHLPAYGYRGVDTPAIDSLKRDGVLFTSAWSHCPMTLPSHVSMLTGLLPTEHGVRNNIGYTFRPEQHATIAQALHEHGYATGAAVSAFVLRGRTGLAGAFDSYDDVDDRARPDTALDLERPGAVTVQRAVQWIDGQKGKPFFLFVHLFEPHAPYEPPEPFRSKYASAYDGEIAVADAAVGQLIEELKRRKIYDDALVILTADHGEGLGDHGESQHSVFLYSEEIHVPLVVKLPRGERAGTSIGAAVQHADIAPAIAALARVPFNAGKTARSLFDTPKSDRIIYSETLFPRIHLGWSDLASALDNAFHYIEGPRPELYDIRGDPHERRDLMATDRRDAARLRARLEPLRAASSKIESIDLETAKSLAALGYVGGVRAGRDAASLPNPRDHIAEYEAGREDLADGIAIELALERNDVAAAARSAERIIRRAKPSAAGLLLAAKVALRQGDPRHAVALLDRARSLARGPMPQLEMTRGNALAAAGRFEEAKRAYWLEIESFPDDLTAWATLSALYFAMNDAARGHATLQSMFDKNRTRNAALLAARTCAAVEDMTAAARWQELAKTIQ